MKEMRRKRRIGYAVLIVVAALLIYMVVFPGFIPIPAKRTMDAIAFTPDGTLVGRGQMHLDGRVRWYIRNPSDYVGTLSLTGDGMPD